MEDLKAGVRRLGAYSPHVPPLEIRALWDSWPDLLGHCLQLLLDFFVHQALGNFYAFRGYSNLSYPLLENTGYRKTSLPLYCAPIVKKKKHLKH